MIDDDSLPEKHPLVRAGAWTGRAIKAAYDAVDPAFRQHLAETSALGLTFVAGAKTPLLELDDDQPRRAHVFVHGLGGHRGNFVPMQRYFAYRGVRGAVSVGFADKSSIEAMAEQLRTTLHDIVERNELEERGLVLVAHSMGGVVCRAALLDEELRAQVGRLITIETPHAGTELARYLDTRKLRSLRPGSALLAKLDDQLPWRGEPELVCFWSKNDLVVVPPASACVEGAELIERSECSHNGFLLRPGAIRAVYQSASSSTSTTKPPL